MWTSWRGRGQGHCSGWRRKLFSSFKSPSTSDLQIFHLGHIRFCGFWSSCRFKVPLEEKNEKFWYSSEYSFRIKKKKIDLRLSSFSSEASSASISSADVGMSPGVLATWDTLCSQQPPCRWGPQAWLCGSVASLSTKRRRFSPAEFSALAGEIAQQWKAWVFLSWRIRKGTKQPNNTV